MLENIIKFISNYQNIPVEKITKDAHLVSDLGMTSLDLMQLSCAIEEEYGIEIDEDDIVELVTVEKIAEYVNQKVG